MLSFCISFNVKLGHVEFLSDRKQTKGVFIWPSLHFNEKIQGDMKVKWEDEDQTKATTYGSHTAAIQIPTLCHTKRTLDDLPAPLITDFNSQPQSLLSDPHTVILFCKQDLNMTGTPQGFLQELKGEDMSNIDNKVKYLRASGDWWKLRSTNHTHWRSEGTLLGYRKEPRYGF